MAAYLKVIVGPMFSGKSEALIRYLKRHMYAKKKVLAVKPRTDTRQTSIRARQLTEQGTSVSSFDFPAFEVSTEQEVRSLLAEYQPDVLAFDEAQFFESWIVGLVKDILRDKDSQLIVYATGLDQDGWGNPFGHLGELMVYANEVAKLTAICFQCGASANLSCKKSVGNGLIETGDVGIYEARCADCWQPPAT